MTNNKFHEQQFFNALRDIFVGADIEGESGFINLMQIKSRYYQDGVFPRLKSDIDQAVADFSDFREELFDKLYTFFQRYFSESGSIYFRYTPLHQNIYEKVYTDDRDVVLFWKTHMLYYVKTDRIFKSLKVAVDGVDFFFDASNIEHKRANEKRDIIFSFREVAEDGTLIFDTAYTVRGRITKIEEILKALREEGEQISDETLEKAFRVFEKQSEVDYFINKNARAFLEEQFDLWLYQYLFAEKNIWSPERIAQLQALKDIAYKVIGFISQFEDELVKIWNKPKFVRGSHYIVTLDHLIKHENGKLIEALFTHDGMQAQMEEWVSLGMLNESSQSDDLFREITAADLTGAPTRPELHYLPLDTKHFPDVELQILACFENLDENIDGWLIHSENYQALLSIAQKYSNMIPCVYVDPPYNASSSEIMYENTFKHSSFISMVENRLSISKNILATKFTYTIAIDEVEQKNLGQLLEGFVFPDNKITCLTIIHNRRGQQGNNFSSIHEYAYFIYPNDKSKYISEREFNDVDHRILRDSGSESYRIDAKNCFYPIIVKNGEVLGFGEVEIDEYHPEGPNVQNDDGTISIYPIDTDGDERKWRYARQTVEEIKHNLEVIETKHGLQIYFNKSYGTVRTVWQDEMYDASEYGTKILQDLFSKSTKNLFSYPKSLFLVRDCINYSIPLKNKGIVLDYFAGSGTTAHAVMNLNREDGGSRKYILVEMGDHFQEVIIPRIKKIAFNSKWKDGKPVFEEGESGISHFVKYYSLEQYEEALQKVRYEDADLFNDPNQDPYHAYVFMRDLKLLDSLELDQDANTVRFHPERLYPDIDLAETLSHLRGKWIKHITEEVVEFQDGETMSLTDPDWETLKPMVWWA